MALLGFTDGFQIFRQKRDDCVKRENLMITAMFPDPKSPKDFNSFFRPLVNKLKQLQGKY